MKNAGLVSGLGCASAMADVAREMWLPGVAHPGDDPCRLGDGAGPGAWWGWVSAPAVLWTRQNLYLFAGGWLSPVTRD